MRSLPLSLLMALMLIPIGSHTLNHAGGMEPSRGSVLYVGEGSTFSDIQSAIDSSSEGDLIMVGEGSYHGPILMNRSGITLQGNGTGTTKLIIEGEYQTHHYMIEIISDNVTVKGFTIECIGYLTSGIRIPHADRLSLYDNEFIVRSGKGRGIDIFDSISTIISANTFHLNAVDATGLVSNGSRHGRIIGNTLRMDGEGSIGFFISASSADEIRSNQIHAGPGTTGIGIAKSVSIRADMNKLFASGPGSVALDTIDSDRITLYGNDVRTEGGGMCISCENSTIEIGKNIFKVAGPIGISLERSVSCEFTHNMVSLIGDGSTGIAISGSYINSMRDQITIIGNSSIGMDCIDSRIRVNNDLLNINGHDGIGIRSQRCVMSGYGKNEFHVNGKGGRGMVLSEVEDTISDQMIFLNAEGSVGIQAVSCRGLEVIGIECEIARNSSIGISLRSCQHVYVSIKAQIISHSSIGVDIYDSGSIFVDAQLDSGKDSIGMNIYGSETVSIICSGTGNIISNGSDDLDLRMDLKNEGPPILDITDAHDVIIRASRLDQSGRSAVMRMDSCSDVSIGTQVLSQGPGLFFVDSEASIEGTVIDSNSTSVHSRDSILNILSSTIKSKEQAFEIMGGSIRCLNTFIRSPNIVSYMEGELVLSHFLSVETMDLKTGDPAGSVEMRIWAGPEKNTTFYSTPYFGGSDPVTPSSGSIRNIAVEYLKYIDGLPQHRTICVEIAIPSTGYKDRMEGLVINERSAITFHIDGTPVSRPVLDPLPFYVPEPHTIVTGVCDPHVEVIVSSAVSSPRTFSNASGRFSVNVSLQEGRNTIIAQARNRYDISSSTSYPVHVAVDTRLPVPVIIGRSIALEGEKVTFNGSLSYDENGIVYYRWEIPLTHPKQRVHDPLIDLFFNVSGEYSVNLTVTDPVGNTATAQHFLRVLPNPSPRVLFTDPVNGEKNIGIDRNVTIAFSSPMERSSIEGRIQIYPHKPYLIEWSDDATALTIHFPDRMDPGTNYLMYINGLLGANTRPMSPQTYQFEFTTGLSSIRIWIDGPDPGRPLPCNEQFRVWGHTEWIAPNTLVQVEFNGQYHYTVTGGNGSWECYLLGPDTGGVRSLIVNCDHVSSSVYLMFQDEDEKILTRLVIPIMIGSIIVIISVIYLSFRRKGDRDPPHSVEERIRIRVL